MYGFIGTNKRIYSKNSTKYIFILGAFLLCATAFSSCSVTNVVNYPDPTLSPKVSPNTNLSKLKKGEPPFAIESGVAISQNCDNDIWPAGQSCTAFSTADNGLKITRQIWDENWAGGSPASRSLGYLPWNFNNVLSIRFEARGTVPADGLYLLVQSKSTDLVRQSLASLGGPILHKDLFQTYKLQIGSDTPLTNVFNAFSYVFETNTQPGEWVEFRNITFLDNAEKPVNIAP